MNSQDSYVWKNEEATIRCLKILFDEILFLAADRRLFNQSCSTFEKKKKEKKENLGSFVCVSRRTTNACHQ